MSDGDAPGTVERLRVRRRRLAMAADGLEQAITSAAGDTTSWRGQVRRALEELGAALTAHVAEADGPGGLFDEIAATSPRLLPTVERLRRDHDDLAGQVRQLEVLVAGDEVPAVRDAALTLLADISRHRHRGADLMWELYDVDIGGGG